MSTPPEEIPDDFDFNLEPKSKRIKLGGVPHVLREATEDAAAARSNSALKTIRFEGDVTHGAANAECDAILLQKCLFKLGPGGPDGGLAEYPVTLAFVKGLPSRVSKPLVDWVEQNSDLVTKKKGEEDPSPKGVPSAGSPSSS